jgi:hypothetical protein
MFDDPFEPYEEPNPEPLLIPGGDGWWQLVGGVWRWMTEPLPRPAIEPLS